MEVPIIPTPQKMKLTGGWLELGRPLAVVLSGGTDDADRFAAEYLCECLKADFEMSAGISDSAGDAVAVSIGRGKGRGPASKKPEGYKLSITSDGVEIEGNDAAGVYYGTQTLRQCFIRHGGFVMLPHVEIEDHPDLKHRSMHYDTKHHQDTYEYVQGFIRELAHYKANVLVWEWEDKLEYPSHPEVGAPGAFTTAEMQELTRYARQHHVQIVPLVQGLGHVAFILKHPEHKHCRELPYSDWEFCPLKDESYELLFDLWRDSMEATPGSEFLHIGSDEVYELGQGVECGCAAKMAEIGKDGLMQIFIRRCVEFVESEGRTALSWGGRWKPESEHLPPDGMVFVDKGDVEYLRAASEHGYAGWVYSPNPGIAPLILPFEPWTQSTMWRDDRRVRQGSFIETSSAVSRAAASGLVDGSITTSWDDSGLHNQMWMPRFVCAAEYSWNAGGPPVDEWIDRFYANYFGPGGRDLRELQRILQSSAQFYYDTFERRVWHWGDIGKIHLPDLPRGGTEYSDFWRGRYAGLLQRAQEERHALARALRIIDDNLSRDVRRRYDLEIMRSCTALMMHNVELIFMLEAMEAAVSEASDKLNYVDRKEALARLRSVENMIEEHLADREKVYAELVTLWERTRLPKGMSTKEKKFFFSFMRARHLANRNADMRYLVMDEDKLDLEGYLAQLKEYNDRYEKHDLGR